MIRIRFSIRGEYSSPRVRDMLPHSLIGIDDLRFPDILLRDYIRREEIPRKVDSLLEFQAVLGGLVGEGAF